VGLLLWVILFIIGSIGYILIDFQLGRRRHKLEFSKFTFPLRKSDVQIFASGPELFEEFFADLKNAKHHIHCLFYIVQYDDFSQIFLSILKEKAKEGINVRLLLDWVGSIKFPRKEVKALRSVGVEMYFCHVPKFPYLFYSLQERNHRKITVIDGKIGYLGGFNIGKEYINKDSKLSPWRDYHLKLVGEGVLDLQKQFFIDWLEASDENKLDDQTYYPQLSKGNIIHRFFPSEGIELEKKFIEFISLSKRSIYIGTPYFIPGKHVYHSLLRALERGVEITILVPENSDHILVKEASYRYFRKLLEKGGKVYQYTKGFYHAKTLIIDDELVDIGTANFDKRSLYLNHEMNCIFFDYEVIKKMKSIFEEDLSHSHLLTLEELNKRSFTRMFKEWIAFILSPLL